MERVWYTDIVKKLSSLTPPRADVWSASALPLSKLREAPLTCFPQLFLS